MEKILKWNAEFARNLWLEFSVQRVVAMPGIILLVMLLILTGNDQWIDGWRVLHYFSLSGFVLIGLLWGLKNAADSILDEHNEKTWDWQKMSVIGPWKLALGKLFGSTVYNWYGALICWVIYMVTSTGMPNPVNEYKIGILLLTGMIALPGLMILVSLQMLHKNDGRSKIKSNSIFISGIILMIFMSKVFGLSVALSDQYVHTNWYGIHMSAIDISIFSALFYCAWITGGLYRSMRAELQYSDAPTWWLLFIVSNFVFQLGYFFSQGPAGVTLSLALLFAEMTGLVYFLSFSDGKDIVNFRTLQQSYSQKNFRHFFENVPLWMVTLPLAFATGLLAVLCNFLSPANSSDIMYDLNRYGHMHALFFWLSICFFVIRDLGILLLLNFSGSTRRADTAMLIYLLLLYVLLPMLTKEIGIGAAFYPDFTAGATGMIAFPFLEAIVVVYLLVQRWKQVSGVAA